MQAADQGQFVKIYLAGIKNTAKLTKAGMQIFEIVYNQMRGNPQFGVEMSERTYQLGLRELLENESLYRSPSADVFFVNITLYHVYVQRQPNHPCQGYYLKEAGMQVMFCFKLAHYRNAGRIAL
jgi:hypothetical protein